MGRRPPDKVRFEENLGLFFLVHKKHVVNLYEATLMRGHNIYLYGQLLEIISELSWMAHTRRTLGRLTREKKDILLVLSVSVLVITIICMGILRS